MGKRLLGWALLLAVLATPVAGLAAAPRTSKPIHYEGLLQDVKRRPIGGIYPLTFSIFKAPKGGKPVWSESHFVAVDGGRYVVELGRSRPMPPGVNLEDAYLGVALTGGDEIVREKVKGEPAEAAAPEPGEPAVVGPRPPTAHAAPVTTVRDGKVVVDYAETAGEAYEAHHAKVADKLGTLTAADLEEKLKTTTGKVNIGATKRFTASAGGEGGTPYEIICPKGHVVTGVRGGSGLYLDSIKLVCQPLE